MKFPVESPLSIRKDVDLATFCTMQVGGPAKYYAQPHTEEDLREALRFSSQHQLPVFILGKGSNVIFPDSGYPGLVISMTRFGDQDIRFDSEKSSVYVSAGVFLYKLALACQKNGFGGAEFLASIPGTVGGALMMNAGYSRHPGQKNEIGDLVEEVYVMDAEGKRLVLTKDKLEFNYRHSNLENFVVLGAKLKFWHRRSEDIQTEIDANFKYRNDHQDLKHPSSGSIFKNPAPPQPSAGKLIDSLNLKGMRVGGAMVSERHGNYIINANAATASDVIQLIHQVQKLVFDATQILLEPEVRIINRS